MDFNSALDIIIKDLGEAAKIIDDLKNYSGVPAFQVELAKAKCRSAAEIIALLKEMPVAPEVVKTPEALKKPDAPPIVKPSEPREIPAALIEEAPVPPKMETVKPVVEKPVSPKAKGGSAAIFADRFKDVPGRVNEKVQALRPEEDLTSRLKQSPISNLADAIGVNDRFYFVREVFGGNNSNYREAIERLNSVSKVNEAMEIIHGYTGEETNQEAVSDLLALVKRKTGFDE